MISVTSQAQAVCSQGGQRPAPAAVWFSYGPDTSRVLVEEKSIQINSIPKIYKNPLSENEAGFFWAKESKKLVDKQYQGIYNIATKKVKRSLTNRSLTNQDIPEMGYRGQLSFGRILTHLRK